MLQLSIQGPTSNQRANGGNRRTSGTIRTPNKLTHGRRKLGIPLLTQINWIFRTKRGGISNLTGKSWRLTKFTSLCTWNQKITIKGKQPNIMPRWSDGDSWQIYANYVGGITDGQGLSIIGLNNIKLWRELISFTQRQKARYSFMTEYRISS